MPHITNVVVSCSRSYLFFGHSMCTLLYDSLLFCQFVFSRFHSECTASSAFACEGVCRLRFYNRFVVFCFFFISFPSVCVTCSRCCVFLYSISTGHSAVFPFVCWSKPNTISCIVLHNFDVFSIFFLANFCFFFLFFPFVLFIYRLLCTCGLSLSPSYGSANTITQWMA